MNRIDRQIDPSTEGPPDTSVAALTESSEAALKAGIIQTHVARPIAWAMTATFLALIFSVPILQAIVEIQNGRHVQALDVLRQWPSRDNVKTFERTLELASVPRNAVRPRVQWAICAWTGLGNSRVTLGRDGMQTNGWLFYVPTIEYVGGMGFLDEQSLRQRRLTALDEREPDLHPDPRPAILQFHRALQSRGIRLVLLPLPTKPMLQPVEVCGGRFRLKQPTPVPNNPDMSRLLATLTAAGVDVFDPTPAVLSPGEPPRFLVQDTHWTPQWMQQVARDLVDHLRTSGQLTPSARPSGWTIGEPTHARRVGDLVDLLQLPPGQTLYPPQTVTIHPVCDARGALWNPRAEADVLLLGDSFCNIYSVASMGWGESAGFPEHFSAALGRDIDLIAINDNGAHATREALARDLARGRDRLAGKRVVVWEFTVRELAGGNWKPIEIGPPATAPARHFIVPKAGEELIVTGVVAARSAVSDPRAVPYADQVMAVHLVDVTDRTHSITEGEALVYLMAMQGKSLTPAAHCREGQTLRLRLRNWNDVAARYGRVSRTELSDESLLTQPPCWAEWLGSNE